MAETGSIAFPSAVKPCTMTSSRLRKIIQTQKSTNVHFLFSYEDRKETRERKGQNIVPSLTCFIFVDFPKKLYLLSIYFSTSSCLLGSRGKSEASKLNPFQFKLERGQV